MATAPDPSHVFLYLPGVCTSEGPASLPASAPGAGVSQVTVSFGREAFVPYSLDRISRRLSLLAPAITRPWFDDGELTQRCTAATPLALRVIVLSPVDEAARPPSEIDPRSLAAFAPAVAQVTPLDAWLHDALPSSHARRPSKRSHV